MLEHGGLVTLHEPFDNIADHGSTVVNGHPVSDPAELITTLRGLAGTATVLFKETTDRRPGRDRGRLLRRCRHPVQQAGLALGTR